MKMHNLYETIYCQRCNQGWSGNPHDYPHLREDEYLLCSCGTPLIRKEELGDEEVSVIQPVLTYSKWL